VLAEAWTHSVFDQKKWFRRPSRRAVHRWPQNNDLKSGLWFKECPIMSLWMSRECRHNWHFLFPVFFAMFLIFGRAPVTIINRSWIRGKYSPVEAFPTAPPQGQQLVTGAWNKSRAVGEMFPKLDWMFPKLDWMFPKVDWMFPKVDWMFPKVDWMFPKVDWMFPNVDWIFPEVDWMFPKVDWLFPEVDWMFPKVDWIFPEIDWMFPKVDRMFP
jgi:hypothetical protein